MAGLDYNEDESFRDRLSTVNREGKRNWIYAWKPKGKLYNLRSYLSIVYLLLFFGLPFVKVNGNPLFLINIVERRFILLGNVFWPQDFFIFVLCMITFIVFVIVFTVVFGRVFCGWACPQTIFMEMVFRKIEFWIEGDAPKQKAMHRAPWTISKIARRGTKLLLFFILSFIIGNTFLAYIIGIDELEKIMTEPVALHKAGFSGMLVFTAVFFFIYSWFREQVCIVVCPYGRLQGVLLDKNSMVVAYDYKRGEPRDKLHKDRERSAGDCINCYQCVNVCPTGIDIRNGTQLECVNCTACIDACDVIMDKIHKPRGLIRIASEKNIADKEPFRFTSRIKAYIAVLVVLLGVVTTLLVTRSEVDMQITRATGQFYQEQPDGRISNLYNLKLLNKTNNDRLVTLKVDNMPGEIQIVGQQSLKLSVAKASMAQVTFFVVLNPKDIKTRKTKVSVGVYEGDEKVKSVKVNFLGPVGGG